MDISKVLMNLIFSALGYFTVAVLCDIAGFFVLLQNLNISLNWSTIKIPHIIPFNAFLLLYIPVYMLRAVLYEQDSDDEVGVSSGDKSVVFFMFTLGVLFLFILLFAFMMILNSNDQNKYTVLLKNIVALLPAIIIEATNTRLWFKDRRNVFFFRNRSLFPALYTCLVSFIYGWSGDKDFYGLLIVVLVLLALWGVMYKMELRPMAVFMISVLFLLIFLFFLTKVPDLFLPQVNNFIQAVTFGVLMTLVMGITESWRISTRIREKKEFGPRQVYEKDVAFYMNGTNFATAVFLPLFFLIFINPLFNMIFIGASVFLLTLMYFVWFAFSKKEKIWGWLGLFFGLMFPLLIPIGANINALDYQDITKDMSYASVWSGWALIAVSMAILSGYLPLIKHFEVPFTDLNKRITMSYYSTKESCVALTGFTAALLSLLISIVSVVLVLFFLKTVDGSQVMFYRIMVTCFIYLIIVVVCVVFLIIFKVMGHYNIFESPEGEHPEKGNAA